MKLSQLELDRQLAASLRALLFAGSPAVERPTIPRPGLHEWSDPPSDRRPL